MPTTLVEIFRDSETQHRLSLFDLPALKSIEAGLFEKNGKPYLKCLATDKDRPAKPEEIVRQLWIHKLMNQYGYPKSRITAEWPVNSGREVKRADVVVFDKERVTVPYIIVEVKKLKLKDGKRQAIRNKHVAEFKKTFRGAGGKSGIAPARRAGFGARDSGRGIGRG